MQWVFVQQEMDTDAIQRQDDPPATSPKFEDLSPEAQKQVKAAWKVIKGLAKASVVGDGKAIFYGSGHAASGDEKMSADDPYYIAVNLSRRP